jgi:hypothetical protein
MVSSFNPMAPIIVVDTDAAVVVIAANLVLNIDGGFPKAHIAQNNFVSTLGLDDAGKIISWVSYYWLSVTALAFPIHI